jgi:hypothetical protein
MDMPNDDCPEALAFFPRARGSHVFPDPLPLAGHHDPNTLRTPAHHHATKQNKSQEDMAEGLHKYSNDLSL